ncbi:hypothetical protein B0T09DRAFT_27927 [Sordaria sp. MPI-SDFR-AT-0083]|nr:hypothetical protein B0T09DRAFT_27927 [Sordaria sp. MPI-SDFR-AT-0083]
MTGYQLLNNIADLYPIESPWKSKSPALLKQLALGNERSGLVPANVLCSRCSRVTSTSKLIRLMLSGDKEQIRKEAQENYTAEAFFHSYSVCDVLSSAASGCHICSIISSSQEIDPDDLDREDPDQGVVQARIKFEAYEEENDEHRLYLFIEDVGWLPIPAGAAEDYELLDSLLQEQLDRRHDRWASQIDYLKILPIKEKISCTSNPDHQKPTSSLHQPIRPKHSVLYDAGSMTACRTTPNAMRTFSPREKLQPM